MEPNDIEALPSADNGNIPVDAPSVETTTEAPTEKTETVTTTEPTAPELYELPDGRKVDGVTVAQEYKNLLSDYTRKSQELAQVKNGHEPLQKQTTETPTDEYVPQTYEELFQIAEQRALKAIEAKEQARLDERKQIEDTIASQLSELKTTDPSLNESALFTHATKYGFKDLKIAHQNMKDMNALAKNVQQTTVKNIQKRNDPVSAVPGATGQRPNPSGFSSAVEYFRSLK
jgi:hypothetical protein